MPIVNLTRIGHTFYRARALLVVALLVVAAAIVAKRRQYSLPDAPEIVLIATNSNELAARDMARSFAAAYHTSALVMVDSVLLTDIPSGTYLRLVGRCSGRIISRDSEASLGFWLRGNTDSVPVLGRLPGDCLSPERQETSFVVAASSVVFKDTLGVMLDSTIRFLRVPSIDSGQ